MTRIQTLNREITRLKNSVNYWRKSYEDHIRKYIHIPKTALKLIGLGIIFFLWCTLFIIWPLFVTIAGFIVTLIVIVCGAVYVIGKDD